MAKRKRHKLLLLPLLALIWGYRLCISPFTASACRFQPTCSAYASEAIMRHGIAGVWLALKRISRCHPWGGHGYDPIPETIGKNAHAAQSTQ